jgi:hypothetical protein
LGETSPKRARMRQAREGGLESAARRPITLISNLMCSRVHLAALGGVLLVALQTPRAESRSSAMQVRVNVVRACSIDTRGAGEMGTIALTCTGASTGGVITTGSGPNARVVPVPSRQTTVVSAPAAPRNDTDTTTAPAGARVRQIVTVNF